MEGWIAKSCLLKVEGALQLVWLVPTALSSSFLVCWVQAPSVQPAETGSGSCIPTGKPGTETQVLLASTPGL